MEIRGSYRWRSKWPGDGGRRKPTRRMLLAAPFLALLRAQKPEIRSFDFSLLDDWTVPAELFFVREHFPAPAVSAAGWKLSVTGAVAAPLEVTFDDLAHYPRKALPVTLECAENPVGGGLVGHAEWVGCSLAAVLEKARVTGAARFVRLTGADGFERTIPLEKAIHPDTVIARSMNGDKLPVSHGFPLRAIVPGWYGMDSVKWLRSVELLPGASSHAEYTRLTRSLLAGAQPAGPVAAMEVKSAFSRPLDGAILSSRRFIVRGAAWAGENRVRRVELSTDEQRTWAPANVASDPLPYCWVHWSYEWKIPGRGQYALSVRAEDDRGRRQPTERQRERADPYELNSWQTVRVTVA